MRTFSLHPKTYLNYVLATSHFYLTELYPKVIVTPTQHQTHDQFSISQLSNSLIIRIGGFFDRNSLNLALESALHRQLLYAATNVCLFDRTIFASTLNVLCDYTVCTQAVRSTFRGRVNCSIVRVFSSIACTTYLLRFFR